MIATAAPQAPPAPSVTPAIQTSPATPSPRSNDDNSRREKLIAAATWYTETLSLTVIPLHYPINGLCSCGDSDCRSPGKHPAVRQGFLTNTDLQVHSGKDAAEVWESRPWNIGVLVGAHFGLFVFDVDPRHGGTESLADLRNDLHDVVDFDATYHYNTSGGGAHYYFKVDVDDRDAWQKIRKVKFNLRPGIEFKAPAGLVVAAPSLHVSGEFYTRPATAPNEIKTFSSQEIDRMLSVLTPKRRQHALTSISHAGISHTSGQQYSFKDLAEMDLSVDYYKTAIQDLCNGEEGAPSRILEHFLFTGTAPPDNFRIPQGQQNQFVNKMISKIAKHEFGKDEQISQGMYRQWVAAGGIANRQTNRIIPANYRMLCEAVIGDICVPDPELGPYPQAQRSKFTSMMTDNMLSIWTEIGLL